MHIKVQPTPAAFQSSLSRTGKGCESSSPYQFSATVFPTPRTGHYDNSDFGHPDNHDFRVLNISDQQVGEA